jgi:hypothetical protein
MDWGSEHTLKKMKKQATMGIKKTPYVITHAMSGAYPPMRSGTARLIGFQCHVEYQSKCCTMPNSGNHENTTPTKG